MTDLEFLTARALVQHKGTFGTSSDGYPYKANACAKWTEPRMGEFKIDNSKVCTCGADKLNAQVTEAAARLRAQIEGMG